MHIVLHTELNRTAKLLETNANSGTELKEMRTLLHAVLRVLRVRIMRFVAEGLIE